MTIEKLDKSLSYESLESARKLANEMQRQASDYAKVVGKEKGKVFHSVVTFPSCSRFWFKILILF